MNAPTAFAGHVTNEDHQPDLSGNLFPVDREYDIDRCEVTGTLPSGLRGSFVRNGPNPMFEPIGRYHMFDGDGMLHSRHLRRRRRGVPQPLDPVARPRGRGSRSAAPSTRVWATSWTSPIRELVGDAGPVKNPANTHIIRHAGRLPGALGGRPAHRGDRLARHRRRVRLRRQAARRDDRASPPRPPHRRDVLLRLLGVRAGHPVLRRRRRRRRWSIGAKIDIPAPVMMHDFVITEHHAVFLDSPIVFDMANLGTGPMVQWRPENGTRIGVMPRLGTADDMRWFEIEPGHVQHFWNGWVDGDRIEFSGCRLAHPDFGIDPNAPLDESVGARRARASGPVLGGPRRGHGRVGAVRRPRWRLLPDQRRDGRRPVPVPVHVGVPRPGPVDRRLRRHREVRRCHRRTPDLERRPDRPRG